MMRKSEARRHVYRKRMSLIEYQKHFDTEQPCRVFLFEKCWPDGFVCPKCGGKKYCILADGTVQCAACHHQASMTAGTVMHRTHVALTK